MATKISKPRKIKLANTLLGEEGTIRVERTLFGQTTTDVETIQIRPFVTTPAKVGYHGSRTINTGNYSSVRVGIWFEIPCYVEEAADVFVRIKEEVEKRLQTEVDEILESIGAGNIENEIV